MKLGSTHVDDTFAEAFGMRYTRLLVTAYDEYWLDAAVREFTGYSSSVIACDAETGRGEPALRRADPGRTPRRGAYWRSASPSTPWPRRYPTAPGNVS